MNKHIDSLVLITKAIQFLLNNAIIEEGVIARTCQNPIPSAATQGTLVISFEQAGLLEKLPKDHLISTFFNMLVPLEDGLFAWDKEEQISNWATARSIKGLLLLDSTLVEDSRVKGAIRWLSQQINIDGGYGFKRGIHSSVIYTYHCAAAFCKVLQCGNDELKLIAENQLKSCSEFLMNKRIPDNGLWTNGSSSQPCAASTLFALFTLKMINDSLPELHLDLSLGLNFAKQFIIDSFHDNYREFWAFPEESASNWRWDEYIPGQMDMILSFFSVDSSIVQSTLGYLYNNYTVDGNHVGWSYPGMNTPVIWITALSIKSLIVYANKTVDTQDPKLINLKMDNSEERLYEKLNYIKNVIEDEVNRVARRGLWLYVFSLVLTWLVLLLVTIKLGWSSMEPWVYFIGLGFTIGSYIYFYITNKEFSPIHIFEKIKASIRRRKYLKFGFSPDEYRKT